MQCTTHIDGVHDADGTLDAAELLLVSDVTTCTHIDGVHDADGTLDAAQLLLGEPHGLHLLQEVARRRHLAHPVGLEPDRLARAHPLSRLPTQVRSLVMQITHNHSPTATRSAVCRHRSGHW